MTIEEEVRMFCEIHVPNGARYITKVRVPAFNGTWQDVFDGRITVPRNVQQKVLSHLREQFGNRDPRGKLGII